MSDSNVYTAERILEKRIKQGHIEYHIKWKGYPYEDSTWEPIENILDRGLLTAFERKEAKKKTKRGSGRSPNKSRRTKNLDDRENSIDNPPATTSKATLNATPPSSPRFERSNTASPTKSPTVNLRSPVAASTSPIVSRNTPTITGSPRTQTPPRTSTPVVSWQTSSPSRSKSITYSPSPVSTPTTVPEVPAYKIEEVQQEPFLNTTEEKTIQRINSNSSPVRITTPLPVNNFLVAQQDSSYMTNNNSSKNDSIQCSKSSRFAILNTVITDVTVNDQTITISESKTNQGFFKEVSRHSVAVDTTHSGDCINMVE